MKIDDYSQQIYTEQDLVDVIMRGDLLPTTHTFLTDSNIDLQPIKWLVDDLPKIKQYQTPSLSLDEFDRQNQQEWLMPDDYKNLDIVAHVLDLCSGEAEVQRAGEELLIYAARDMLDLLRYLTYLVDTMRANAVIWGVGRGSSVASFVLYKIGVHKINSLYYDLDIREFLR